MMALLSDKDKPIKENSFHNFMESGGDPLGKFRPGVLVKVVAGYDHERGTIGMFLKVRQRVRTFAGLDGVLHRHTDPEYLVLVGEEQWYFDAYEIEVL